MTIWIQSLSWTLIFSLGQGIVVYSLLWLVFKLMPGTSPNARYRLSLFALTILLAWFMGTWWQQFHSLALSSRQLSTAGIGNPSATLIPTQHISMPPGFGSLHSLPSSLSTLFPWLCACYLAGLTLMLARLSTGMLQLVSLRNKDTFAPDAALNDLLFALRNRIRLDAPVRLLISEKAPIPMVIGFLKPIVLIPAAALAQLEPKQLESILLHELAHIKRNDYLINILQTIAETILFFNPFVWMIAAITRREREHCCDDLVVNHTPEPLPYATALAILASWRPVTPSVAMAASGRPADLYNRIQRIMEMKKNPFSYSRMIATIVIIATITCSIAWIKPTFTKTKRNKATAATTTKKSEVTKTTTEETTRTGNEKAPDLKKDKAVKATAVQVSDNRASAKTNMSEENLLVQRLLEDRLIDQVKGFLVERQLNKLFINRQLQSDEVANKYLPTLKKEYMRMQVFPLEERLRMHPDADFIKIILPFTLESPCVDKQPVKEGC